jgi:hypothetical protein
VFLKSLVICLISLPQYAKVAHFVVWCLGSVYMLCFCDCDSGFLIRFVLYSLYVFNGAFFVCFDLLVIGYVCNRFSRQLTPDSLCSYGWQDLLGTMISVSVGFLYVENSNFLSLQCILRSKKLIPSCSSSL